MFDFFKDLNSIVALSILNICNRVYNNDFELRPT